MSVRALQARIECDRETVEHLWRTHRVFNERLVGVLALFFQMRRGQIGDTARRRELAQAFMEGILLQDSKNAYDRILKAQNSSHRNTTAKHALAAIATKASKKPKKESKEPSEHDATIVAIAENYEKAFGEFELGWRPLESLSASLRDLPKMLEAKLYQEAVMIIKGYDELVKLWEQEHGDWQKDKGAWESVEEHKRYLALRPRFESFEEAAKGMATKRRERWHKYLDWLRSQPDLAAWRGAKAEIHPISEKGAGRIQRAKPWKKRTVEAEEFWEANPELRALDRLHGQYERQFVRRRETRTTKRPVQGFKNRPTFTLPHALRHPRWLVFSGPQTNPSGYENLDLEARRIDLRILSGEKTEEIYPTKWVTVSLSPDPRLNALQRTVVKYKVHRGKAKGHENEKEGYRFYDRHLMKYRPATVSGAKLLFRDIRLNGDGTLHSATPYLVFTVDLDDEPLTERAKAVKLEDTGELTKKGKKKKKRNIPSGLVTCAVDMGVRHLGFATIARWDGTKLEVLRSRNLWLDNLDLAKLSKHKRLLRKLRSKRGDPVAGEKSHVALQEHIDGMADDRFKKAAREIVNFALNLDGRKDARTGAQLPRADVLILENLETLIPNAEKERGINRMIVAFNRGHVVDRVHEMAKDAGLKVWEVNPMGTSQVCSRCGALGRRYTIVRDEKTREPAILFGEVEKLFACPECKYMGNSDHNASVNLHRRFILDDLAVQAWYASRVTETKKREERERIESVLLPMLREKHSLGVETPF